MKHVVLWTEKTERIEHTEEERKFMGNRDMTQALPPPPRTGNTGQREYMPPPPPGNLETAETEQTLKGKISHFFATVIPGIIAVAALALILMIVPKGSSRKEAPSAERSVASLGTEHPEEQESSTHSEEGLSLKESETGSTRFLSSFPLPSSRADGSKATRRGKLIAGSGMRGTEEEKISTPQKNGDCPKRKKLKAPCRGRKPANIPDDDSIEEIPEQDREDPGLEKPRVYVVHESPAMCNQGELEAKAAAQVAARLVKPVELPEPPEVETDWEGLKHYLMHMLVPVPDKPAWGESLRAFRNARVHYAPDLSTDEVGLMAEGSRIVPFGFVRGRGCQGAWIVLGPRAYTCRRNFVWDQRAPKVVKQPPMEEDALVPGLYAYVRPGGTPVYSSRKAAAKNDPFRKLPGGFFVRFRRFVRIDGTNYWETTKNWYIPVDNLARHVPSEFSGIHFPHPDVTLPVAFLLRDHRVYNKPGGAVEDKLPRHSIVPILGITNRGRFEYYRIGPCRWMRSTGTRAAWPSTPPPGVHRYKQWVDLNLEQQTMVMYEGSRPVAATLFSSGNDEHPTQHGIFRVYWKISETDMTSDMGAENEYMAESVPWSLFFWRGQAIHGAYWHDSFGIQRSHGCVNLSPRDARFLMEWAKPDLPDGWIYRWFGERFPGLLIRVRRRDGDLVRFLGFAQRLAPPDAVKEREEAFKERIHQETLELLKRRNSAQGGQGE